MIEQRCDVNEGRNDMTTRESGIGYTLARQCPSFAHTVTVQSILPGWLDAVLNCK